MKSRLLALMALCCATSASLPLWAAEWEDPVPEFADPNLATDGTGGGKYYIYHVATRRFINCGSPENGHGWGTEVVVADEGKEIRLSYDTDYELSNRPETDKMYSTAKGWRMVMWEGKSNTGRHEIYYSPSDEAFCVDHNKQGHMLWKIMKQEDGNYRIKIIDEDPLYGSNSDRANTYWGLKNDSVTKVEAFINPEVAGNENASYDWKFMTPEAYEIYQAKLELKNQLVKADEAGFKDYAEYEKVYSDASATLDAVKAASKALQAAVYDFQFASASKDNPVDLTDKIVNPSFDNGTNGWTPTRVNVSSGQDNFQAQSSTQTTSDGTKFSNFFERWVPGDIQPDWSITQELNDIPDGLYRLSAYILTNVTEENGGPKGRFLYAKSKGGEVTFEANVPSPYDDKGKGYAAPYSLEFSVIGGTATVGMKVQNANSNWSGVDNFKLEFLGKEGATSLQDYLKEHVAEAENTYKEYQAGNKQMSKKGEDAFNEFIKYANEVAASPNLDNETAMEMIDSLQKQVEVLAKDVAAYDKLSQLLNEAENKYWASPFEDQTWTTLEGYLDDTRKELEDKSFDPALIDSVQPRMDRYYMEDFRAAVVKGEITELTTLIVNPNFDGGVNGWQGGTIGYGENTAEMYEKAPFDVYQEIEGLPEGSYEITVQGFQRPTFNDDCQKAWGTDQPAAQVTAYAYGNYGSIKLHHCYDFVYDTEMSKVDFNQDVQLALEGDEERNGKYAVNNLTSVHNAFEQGDFENKVVCYVRADGKLRLGIRITEQSYLGGAWTAFDNFRLKYLGASDMSGAQGSLAALANEARVMLEETEPITTKASREGLQKAYDDATNVLITGTELTQELYATLSDALNSAMDLETKSREAAALLEQTAEGHDAKFNLSAEEGGYDGYVDTDAYGDFLSLVADTVLIAIEQGSLEDMAQIEGFMVGMNKAYCKMVATAVDFSGASKEKPADVTAMVANPSFEVTNAETQEQESSRIGWESDKESSSLIAQDLVCEIYNIGDIKLYQTIYALPKGYYRLTYQGFYRAGNAVPAALARRDSTEEAKNVRVFVETDAEKLSEPLASIFDHVTLYSYDEKDIVLADSLFPDMPDLMYHTITNNRTGAHKAFEDGAYEGGFSFEVKADGEGVTIGVEKGDLITADWACFDNFHLYYLGAGEENRPDDIPDGVEEAVADSTATVASSEWYTINGVRVAEPTQRGIYIRKDKMSDGTTKAVKVMKH